MTPSPNGVVVLVALVLLTTVASTDDVTSASGTVDVDPPRAVLRWLFEKYGNSNLDDSSAGEPRMSFEGFEHLLESLGLGQIVITDHDVSDHHLEDGRFREFHDAEHHHVLAASDDDVTGGDGDVDARSAASSGGERTRRRRQADGNRKGAKTEKSLAPLSTCLSAVEILLAYRISHRPDYVTKSDFLSLCPAIIYQLDEHVCHGSHHPEHSNKDWHCAFYHRRPAVMESKTKSTIQLPPAEVWGCATLAIAVISIVGLAAVALVPVMGRRAFSNHIQQFLIALAIGTLTGDALLHLLPHALMVHEETERINSTMSKEDDETVDDHALQTMTMVQNGLAVLTGIFAFFFIERLLGLYSEYKQDSRSAKHKSLAPTSVRLSPVADVGRKLSGHDDHRMSMILELQPTGTDTRYIGNDQSTGEQQSLNDHHDVITTVDHTDHRHGHSHVVPTTVASVAWMVIMGDGLHNFTDGLAIGASFANSIAGGLGTSLAVFCHELPHELGDLAVLLSSGMTVKKAILFNVFSSVLSVVGMAVGVLVGNIASASTWIFGLTAGIFIYVSLVDMLPEITKPRRDDRLRTRCAYLALQVFGVTAGLCLMASIAIYEDSIEWMTS